MSKQHDFLVYIKSFSHSLNLTNSLIEAFNAATLMKNALYTGNDLYRMDRLKNKLNITSKKLLLIEAANLF